MTIKIAREANSTAEGPGVIFVLAGRLEMLRYHDAELTCRSKNQLGSPLEDCKGLRAGNTIAAENGAEETLLWLEAANCK
jgi:hypothetical protein